MSGLERDVMYKPGATFYKEGKFLMFRFQADSSSVIGPRVATDADKAAHGAEYDMLAYGQPPATQGRPAAGGVPARIAGRHP
jgi:hypothetical protein